MAEEKEINVEIEQNGGEKPPIMNQHRPHHHQPHHHHTFHAIRKLRQLILPEGFTVFIAHNPQHADSLRRSFSDPKHSCVVHGSKEHVDAIRASQQHHEGLRGRLREKHGGDFDELELVIQQMDALSAEMEHVTEHAVQLDSNFSKYGYGAHIRTHDSTDHSSASSLLESDGKSTTSGKHDWEDREHGESMKFWVKPIVRQYIHKGLLWRASEKQEVASYELFVDLLYVGLVGIAGDAAVDDASGETLLRFAIIFTMAWKYWSEITQYMAWFDSDDISRRLAILFILATLLGFTTNIEAFYDGGGTWTPLVSFYLAARLFSAVYYFWYAYLLPMIAFTMLGSATIAVISSALWIISIHISHPAWMAPIWIALFLDMFGHVLLVMTFKGAQKTHLVCKRKIAQWLEFSPALNIEHRVERTNAFVTLVFGYSVLSLLFQNAKEVKPNAFLGKAILGLMQAFAFNTVYFELDNFNMHSHAIRRDAYAGMVWISIHLPLMMSYVLAGASLARLVVAHDCGNTDEATLLEPWKERSQAQIDSGQRWFYCAGLGVSLMCTGVISLTHEYKVNRTLIWSRTTRSVVRFGVSLALIFLGFADSLNSLDLIGTTTSLLVMILIYELVGNVACDHANECHMNAEDRTLAGFIRKFFSKDRKCKYSAKCHMKRKDLEASVMDGTIIKVDELKGVEKGAADRI